MRALTEEIDSRLRQLVVHLNEERWQPFLPELEMLLPPDPGDAENPSPPCVSANALRRHEPLSGD